MLELKTTGIYEEDIDILMSEIIDNINKSIDNNPKIKNISKPIIYNWIIGELKKYQEDQLNTWKWNFKERIWDKWFVEISY